MAVKPFTPTWLVAKRRCLSKDPENRYYRCMT
jgi:hypothetical protein